MNGQHRGDGHPYGGDEPTPSPSGQESFRPRHGSPWPDEERAEHPYGPGQERPGAPYEGTGRPPGYADGGPYGGADPYAGGPRGGEPRPPYPPADRPEADTAAPTSAFQAFMAGEDRGPRDAGYRPAPPPGPGPHSADPYPPGGDPSPDFVRGYPQAGGPQNASPYGEAPPSGAPYGEAPPRGAPYGEAPPSTDPYGDAPRGSAPYGEAAGPDPGQGRFSAGALGGGMFSSDALGGGPRPEAPGDFGGPQSGPPRPPDQDMADPYRRPPEPEAKPYAPPNAATEALPHVESGDRRVASGNTGPRVPGRVPGSGPRTEQPAGQPEPDNAAPTSAFQAFMAGEGRGPATEERGRGAYERERDAAERGYREFERDRDAEDRGRREFDRGRDAGERGYRGYGRGRDDDAYDEGDTNAPLWSLVLSIVGIVAMPVVGLGVIASVAALFLARTAARSGQHSRMADAGRFLGWIGVGLFAVGVIGGLLYVIL